MAIPDSAVWEVMTTGNDQNGGFFNAARGGVDYSRGAPILQRVDATTSGTTNLTIATAGFTSAMVGNGLNLGGNTVYEIVSFQSATSVTLDRTAPAASGQTLRIGGALATPGFAAGKMVSGNWLWIKEGIYLITVTTQNVSGGPLSLPAGVSQGRNTTVEGYKNTRGDMTPGFLQFPRFSVAPPVTIRGGVAPAGNPLVTGAGFGTVVRNISVDGQHTQFATGWSGLSIQNGKAENVWGYNCQNTTIRALAGESLFGTNQKNGGGALYCQNGLFDSYVNGNSGFTSAGIQCEGPVYNCVVANILGNAAYIHSSNSAMSVNIDRCIAYNCQYGFRRSAVGNSTYSIRNLILSNIQVGISLVQTYPEITARKIALFGVTSEFETAFPVDIQGKVSLAESPFVNAAGGDFRLTPSASIQLRGLDLDFMQSWLSSLYFVPTVGSAFIPLT